MLLHKWTLSLSCHCRGKKIKWLHKTKVDFSDIHSEAYSISQAKINTSQNLIIRVTKYFTEQKMQTIEPDRTLEIYFRWLFESTSWKEHKWVKHTVGCILPLVCYLVALSPSRVASETFILSTLSDSFMQVLPKRPRGQLTALLDACLRLATHTTHTHIYCQPKTWNTQAMISLKNNTSAIEICLTLWDHLIPSVAPSQNKEKNNKAKGACQAALWRSI